MRIQDVIVTPGLGGYYFDDLAAIKAGAKQDGFFYPGAPVTPGHRKVRQAGETISIQLLLADGQVAFGDGAAIQYSGVVGRDPIFIAERYIPVIERVIVPALRGREVTSFREMAVEIERLTDQGERLHTGIRYGVSLALLDAVALTRRQTWAEVIAAEYGTSIRTTPVPVLAQSGDDRYIGADKMILKNVPVIPQGLFNHISKVGEDGSKLKEYVAWLRDRVQRFGEPGYQPVFHLDVYGMVGLVCGNEPEAVADFLCELERLAAPYALRIEHPVEVGDRDALLELMVAVRAALAHRGSQVELAADDWVNTLEDVRLFADRQAAHMIQVKAPDLGSIHNAIEAVLYCKSHGVQAFLGGTCNETDKSTRMTVHVALATNADLIYNKPGMGVDEGTMIVTNEMNRTLALLKARGGNVHAGGVHQGQVGR